MKYLVILLLCSCSSIRHNPNVVYDADFHSKDGTTIPGEFRYAIDNKGNKWTKQMILYSGTGTFQSLTLPPELEPVKKQLQK